MDLSIAYQNGAFIPDSDAYPDKWATSAHDWRSIEHTIGRARLNVPYGKGPRQQLDIFYPSGRPAGLMIFIHGGYWRAFDRKMWSHFASGATARDWAVAMPSYTLAPKARIAEITLEIADAVNTAAGIIAGPIVITGHSAGGHLAARMACADAPLAVATADRLQKIVPISPLSDLRPLMKTDLNADLRLDEAEAETESPVLIREIRNVPVTVWVGSEERPAFLDQARWLSETWETADLRIATGKHHFDVIDDLLEADSPMMRTLIDRQ